MYAIIEDSGTQYKVSPGDVVDVDLRELAEGQDTVEFERVLMISGADDEPTRIGTPMLEGAKVVARINGEIKDNKIYIHKLRRRKGYKRKTGHRQRYIRVTIDQIVA